MPISRAESAYSVHDFWAKLFIWRNDAPPQPRHSPACHPCAYSLCDAAEACCIPISWQHHIATLGEWELTALVHKLGVRLPTVVVALSQAERRAFAALGTRAPAKFVAADCWRSVAEDSLERWWRVSHGEAAKDVRFELAREHTLRGLPRVRRGDGAGDFLRTPVPSAHIPLEERGVSHVRS